MDYQEWRDQKDRWRDEKRLWRQQRRERWGRSGRPLMALILIALGALFLLDNLGVIYFRDLLRDFWPVILIALGLNSIANSRHPSGWLFGGLMIAMASIFLLHNFGYIRANGWQFFWPLMLITAGASMLLRRGGQGWGHPPRSLSGATTASMIDEWVMFGGVKRRVESQEFEGGEAAAMFGGIEIDLRNAATKKDEVRIEANAMFGGIEIRVPETWDVVVRGTAIFGGYEDKTMGRRGPDEKRPLLLISGHAVFGGVGIKN